MRELTKKERELIDNDLEFLERFCSYFGFLNTEYFKDRYNAISVCIGDFKKGSKLKGYVVYNPNTVELNEEIINDDYLRLRTLYHEVGHLLFNYPLMSQKEIRELRNKQMQVAINVPSSSHYLEPNPNLAMAGYKMLHEYICEKFSSIAANSFFHQKPTRKYNQTGDICGENYKFNTTFDGNYGLIESVCDEFFSKYYSSVLDILKECLNNSFYLQLYDKYNEIDVFRFLENLGRLYNVFDSYHEGVTMFPKESSIKVMQILNKLAHNAKLNDQVHIDREVARVK